MPTITSINAQNAGYFSELAYLPIGLKFADAKDGLSSTNFPGWTEITNIPGLGTLQNVIQTFSPTDKRSGDIFTNQFRIFTNGPQIVFAFKGSNTASNWADDLKNSGGVAFQQLQPAFAAVFGALKSDLRYSNAQFIMDGHSLGGGLAQTFALAVQVDGFGQNSLPISTMALNSLSHEFSSRPGDFQGRGFWRYEHAMSIFVIRSNEPMGKNRDSN